MATSLVRSTLVAGLLGQVFAQTYDAPSSPDQASFYFPDNIDGCKPGSILNTRSVTTKIYAPGSPSYEISFCTTDNNGEASSSVATVWQPYVQASGPPQIFAYQYAEDAITIDCAPSWAWVEGSASTSQPAERVFQGPIVIPWALDQGFFVVSTDAEGPNSAWLAGKIEGHAVLDAIQAAITFYNLAQNSNVGLYGYSGGAHTTVWAATLAHSYAPLLNIVGAAYGGTPIDLAATFKVLNGTTNSLLAGAALLGLGNAYPELETTLNDLQDYAPDYSNQVDGLRQQMNCTQVGSGLLGNPVNWNDVWPTNERDILQNPTVASVLAEESLLQTDTPVPKFPRFMYHGYEDSTVPWLPAQEYVTAQCQADPSLPLTFVTLPAAEHILTSLLGLPAALSFVATLLSGKTFDQGPCGSNYTVPVPGSNEAATIMTQTFDDYLVDYINNNTQFTD